MYKLHYLNENYKESQSGGACYLNGLIYETLNLAPVST